jgi:hypothetical protein
MVLATAASPPPPTASNAKTQPSSGRLAPVYAPVPAGRDCTATPTPDYVPTAQSAARPAPTQPRSSAQPA